MFKRLLIFCLSIVTLFTLSGCPDKQNVKSSNIPKLNIVPYTSVSVLVNNNTVNWNGSTPILVNGTTYVPIKEACFALQFPVTVDLENSKVVILSGVYESFEMDLRIGSNVANLNDKRITLPGPIRIINNRVMGPIRLFENLGGFVALRDNTVMLFNTIGGALTYSIVSGDMLWKISQMFNVTVDSIRTANNLTSDVLGVGQKLTINTTYPNIPTYSATIATGTLLRNGPETRYTAIAALASGTSVTLTGKWGTWYMVTTPSGSGFVPGNSLSIPQDVPDPGVTNTYYESIIPVNTGGDTTTTITYTVTSGDSTWSLSEKFGIPEYELRNINNIAAGAALTQGQTLTIPVHTIAVTQPYGTQYGELLDWFTEAQYVFPIGKKGTLIDMATGKNFNVQRTMGANHSDTETVTSADTATMKQIFGGVWTWNYRPFILVVDGRRLAVSVTGMSHAGRDDQPFMVNVDNRSGQFGYGPNLDRIKGNGMDGHFDIYFLNCVRHGDNFDDPDHQRNVLISGGLQ